MNTSIRGDLASKQETLAISALAYRLWHEQGRPPRRYMDFWIKATKLVMEAQKSADEKRHMEKAAEPANPTPPEAPLVWTGE